MAELVKESNKWKDSIDQTKINKTYTFNTNKKYVDKDIEMNVNVPGMNLENNQSFYINDGLYIWNWEIDNDGNVTIY